MIPIVRVIITLTAGIILGLLSTNNTITLIVIISTLAATFLSANVPTLPLVILILYIPLHSAIRELTPIMIGSNSSILGVGKDLLILLLLLIAFTKMLYRKKIIYNDKLILYSVIFFIGWVFLVSLISVLHGADLAAVIFDARDEITFISLMIALPPLAAKLDEIHLLRVMILSALVPILVGLFQITQGERVVGTFAQDQTNIFGLFLVMIWLIIVVSLRIEKNSLWRGLYIVELFFTTLIIGYTQSRRALLAVLVALIVLFPKLDGKVKKSIIVLSIPLILATVKLMLPRLLLIYGSLPTYDALLSIINNSSFSDYDSLGGYFIERRFLETVGLFEMIKSNPFFGIGLGKIGYYSVQYGISNIYLHNYYLSLWLRLGIIGLITYFIIIIGVIKYARKQLVAVKSPATRITSLLAFAFSSSMLVTNLFGTHQTSVQVGFLFWLINSIVFSKSHQDELYGVREPLLDNNERRG